MQLPVIIERHSSAVPQLSSDDVDDSLKWDASCSAAYCLSSAACFPPEFVVLWRLRRWIPCSAD